MGMPVIMFCELVHGDILLSIYFGLYKFCMHKIYINNKFYLKINLLKIIH